VNNVLLEPGVDKGLPTALFGLYLEYLFSSFPVDLKRLTDGDFEEG
jgi:hypothetical protein